MDGADAKCQAAANAAGIGGARTYKAWLSSSTQSAAERLTHADVPYVRTDGVKVADNWDAIVTDGLLDARINLDEYGVNSWHQQSWVWTSTAPRGYKTTGDRFCNDWTSTSGYAVYGAWNDPSGGWSHNAQVHCSADYLHLYCFEEQVTEIAVDIDIKPGSYPNAININGNGVIPVAVLGSAEFDANQVDVSTLTFAGLAVRVKGNGAPQCSFDDVSGTGGVPDGSTDLVCQFVDDPINWVPGDGVATLEGNLLPEFGGTAFKGSDVITIVP